MRSGLGTIVVAAMTVVLLGCPSGQQGIVQGTVTPPTADVAITIAAGTTTMASSSPDARTGAFSISVAPGTYNIAIVSPSSPFPVVFTGIMVEPGRSVSLGIIQLAQVRGTGSINGRISCGKAAARVSLFMDGRERASAATDKSGRYALKELAAGSYVLHVQAPDYAADARSVVVGDGQQATVDLRMLYVTALDGVDWARGTIRVRGVGAPPSQTANPTVRKEMAKRAAVADAERNLLRVIDMIETGPGETLSSFLGPGTYTQTIEGYLRGYRIAAERGLDAGKVEVELELPLTGPDGLSARLPAK